MKTATITSNSSATVTDHDSIIAPASPREAFRSLVVGVNGKGDATLTDAGRIVAIIRDSFDVKIRQNVKVKLSDGETVIMTVDKDEAIARMSAMSAELRKIADAIDAIPADIASNPQSWGVNRPTVAAATAAPLGKNAGLLLL